MAFLDNIIIKTSLWSVRKVIRILFLALLGSILIGITVFLLYMQSLPSLSTWHTTKLENEFTQYSKVKDFNEYLVLEKRLFNEMDREIYDKVLPNEKNRIQRYTRNSVSDPIHWENRWNKSFELSVDNPKMGILLLHGMSDSPYSLNTQAEYLHKKGVWVVSMRMPGHGTVPSGLRDVRWQDMAKAVKIGMKRLSDKLGDKPIHIMGYSTGAPLALNYTLSALDDTSLRQPDRLIFYSPAVGVSKVAPLAIWQSRMGYFFGLPKLEWNSIVPEFDPFKYGSFAVNAGDQVYRLCNHIQERLDEYLSQEHNKQALPPILSFASIVDSTVSVNDTVNKLYNRLPAGDHTLVLFDINHDFITDNLVKRQIVASLDTLRQVPQNINYTFDLITDINSTDSFVSLIRNGKNIEKLPYKWPKKLYSLSHLSLPITPYDPLYGNEHAPESPGIQLGYLALYGENSVLETSAAALLRQRWNPFHSYIKQRVLEFMELE